VSQSADTPVYLGPLEFRAGLQRPVGGTPQRRGRSLRRTATTDMVRLDPAADRLELVGRARDLWTEADGTAVELDRAGYRAEVDIAGGWELRELSCAPERPALRALIGCNVGSGFRGKVLAADPALGEHGAPLYQLLDDVPVTTLVSGYSRVAGAGPDRRPPARSRPTFGRDNCAGFVDGGRVMTVLDAAGVAPISRGPAAPPLTSADPLGWHELPVLAPHGMRRYRRTDVCPGPETTVDMLYRDVHVDADGVETIVHEYTAAVVIDGDRVRGCVATPRVLPWPECPTAAASAAGLAGVPLAGLRSYVRQHFSGVSTCTHLNDLLRSLQDVSALLARCRERR
jgi:hypothetical protein